MANWGSSSDGKMSVLYVRFGVESQEEYLALHHAAFADSKEEQPRDGGEDGEVVRNQYVELGYELEALSKAQNADRALARSIHVSLVFDTEKQTLCLMDTTAMSFRRIIARQLEPGSEKFVYVCEEGYFNVFKLFVKSGLFIESTSVRCDPFDWTFITPQTSPTLDLTLACCYYCGKGIAEFSEHIKVCGKCRFHVYCSRECAKAAWKVYHEHWCIPNFLRRRREAFVEAETFDFDERGGFIPSKEYVPYSELRNLGGIHGGDIGGKPDHYEETVMEPGGLTERYPFESQSSFEEPLDSLNRLD